MFQSQDVERQTNKKIRTLLYKLQRKICSSRDNINRHSFLLLREWFLTAKPCSNLFLDWPRPWPWPCSSPSWLRITRAPPKWYTRLEDTSLTTSSNPKPERRYVTNQIVGSIIEENKRNRKRCYQNCSNIRNSWDRNVDFLFRWDSNK